MNRAVVVSVAVATLVGTSILGWVEVRQAREFRRLLAAGDAAMACDQTYLAIEAFSGAVILEPASMVAHLKRGDTYRRRGELDAARRDLTRAAALDSTAPRPLELLGDVALSQGDRPAASAAYARAIAIDDRAPRVLYKSALAAYGDQRYDAAADALRKAIAIDAGFVEAQHLLGLVLRDSGRRAEAVTALRTALELNPAFVPARDDLAHSLFAGTRPRDDRDRLVQLEALAALEPHRVERLIAVGLAYAGTSRTDAAVLTLGRAAEQHPDSPLPYMALARVWLDVAETRADRIAGHKALEALQAAGARGGDSMLLSLRGRALLVTGDLPGAERALRQAARELPVEPVTLQRLAIAAERLGHAADARAARKRYEALTER